MQVGSPIIENHFIGLCDRYPSHLLPPGLFQKFDNANVDNNQIAKRPGNTPLSTSLGAFAILGGSAFEPAGASKCQIVCRDGTSNSQLYKSTGGAWSAIGSANLTAGAQMNFEQASNYLFGFNGTDVVDVASDETTVTKNRANVPKGKFAKWFHNYLFVAGVSGNPNRLYWSDLGDPTTFSAPNFIDINANDGDSITGLAPFNDELYIFKNNSIWSISGWSGSSFSTTTIAGQNTNSRINGLGTPSHQSIVAVGKELYYLSFFGGIPHFRVLAISSFSKVWDQGVVSLDIETTMKGLNLSQLSKCAGTFDGKRVRWALPNGSSTYNNLVVVLRPDLTLLSNLNPNPQNPHRSWVTYSGITPSQYWHSSVSGRDKIYFGDATTGGFVFEADTSVYTDNGTNVSMDVETRDFMRDPAHKNKWKYSYVKYATGSSGTLNVKARADQSASFALQKSISLAGNSPGLGPTGTFKLGTSALGGAMISKSRVTFAQLVGTLMGMEFTETSSNACLINDFEIYSFPKGLRDD